MKKSFEIIEFIFLTYLITWFFWIPIALSSLNIVPFKTPQLFFLLGAFGPITASIIITIKHSGVHGIKLLLKKLIVGKVHLRWYLISFILPLVIVLLVLLALFVLYGSVRELKFNSIGALTGIFFTSLIVCANEEVAWRGFALPKLQRKNNALISSLIIGLFWGFLHFPLFFIQPERSGGFPLLHIIPGFILMCIFLSIIYTFQYNSTNGSVLLATIFHTSLNTSNELYSSTIHDYDKLALYLFIGIVFIISVFIILRYGITNLSMNPRLTL